MALMVSYLQHAKSLVDVAHPPPPDKKRATVVQNVKVQMDTISTRSITLAQKVRENKLTIFGAVYNMEDGTLELVQ